MKTIRVTKNHIKNGRRYKSGACPIALALKQHYRNRIPAVLSSYDPLIYFPDGTTLYVSKGDMEKMNNFIDSFDLGVTDVKPMTLRVYRTKKIRKS